MPSACHCGTLDQSKGEGGLHRSIDPLEVRAVQNVLMTLVGLHDAGPSGHDETEKRKRSDDHVLNPYRQKTHTGLTGHSRPRNAGFWREAISLVRAATFWLPQDGLNLPDANFASGKVSP
jgi:hypothetical protein